MSSFYDDASLVVIPSGYKTSKVYAEKPTDGSGDLTFTRTGDTATRVNSAGLIEKVRTNYARQSQSFATAAAWTATNGTLTNNAGTAPDGTNTASKIVATNTDPFCYQSITLTGPVVASCYLKAVGSAIGKSAEIRAGVSLTAFTLSGSWQRVSVTHTASAAHNYGLEVPNPGVIGDEVLLWGFQVEGGDVATDYIPTTTAAVSVGPVANVPRLDYLGSTCPRLLLEPQRTNIQINSEDFSQANWDKTNTAIVVNQLASPDGFVNADKLNETAVNNLHQLESSRSVSASTVYTMSVFAKKAERSFVRVYDATTNNSAYFNLDSGTIGTVSGPTATAKIENYGNGWYRCSVTYTETGTFGRYRITIAKQDNEASYLGVAGSGIYVWGAQYEAGAYPTSYIPTLAASATRGADACSKTGISSLIGQTEGVLFADFVVNALNNASNIFNSERNTNASFFLSLLTNGKIDAGLYASGSPAARITEGSVSIGQRAKVAYAYKSGSSALYINGTQVGTSSATFTLPSTLDDLFFNDPTTYFAYQENVSFNQALLFKTRLTNAELAELTTL